MKVMKIMLVSDQMEKKLLFIVLTKVGYPNIIYKFGEICILKIIATNILKQESPTQWFRFGCMIWQVIKKRK